MAALRTIGTVLFVLAPLCIWIGIIIAIKTVQATNSECSFGGGGALGCGSFGNWLYDTSMVFAFFGIIGQVIWFIPALILLRFFRQE